MSLKAAEICFGCTVCAFGPRRGGVAGLQHFRQLQPTGLHVCPTLQWGEPHEVRFQRLESGGGCHLGVPAGGSGQADLGTLLKSCVSSLALQGRRPLSGDWEATRPLLAELLDPGDPLPPSRIFKRPPVRLIHDIVVAAHVRHQAGALRFGPLRFCWRLPRSGEALAAGKPDFSSEQLDYKQLQNADRQAKVDFFELLLAKAGHAVPPLKVSPSDILGGKNTVESNRLLQLLCYLGLRKKLEGSSYGGLLDVSDQWATKFTVSWSEKGQEWAPLTTPSAWARVAWSVARLIACGKWRF
eukprot:s7574_g3.t1